MENSLFDYVSLIIIPLVSVVLAHYIKKVGLNQSYAKKYNEADYLSIITRVPLSLTLIAFIYVEFGDVVKKWINVSVKDYELLVMSLVLLPFVGISIYMFFKLKKEYRVNDGYFFIIATLFTHYTTACVLLLLEYHLVKPNIEIPYVSLYGVLLVVFILFSSYFMVKAISNEIVFYKYIVTYGTGKILITEYLIDNKSEILVCNESNDKFDFLIEIPKTEIRSINIIKSKKKLYGNKKSKTAPNTTVSKTPT